MMLKFEWDEAKAEENYRKHNISFETASKVFADENRIEIFDKEHSSKSENRFITIGEVNKVLFVVYCVRMDRIRLISARAATAEERRLYYDYL